MLRKTFLGARIRWVISQTACFGRLVWIWCGLGWQVLTVSKSMDVNLKSRRKKGGIRMVVRLCEVDIVLIWKGWMDVIVRR